MPIGKALTLLHSEPVQLSAASLKAPGAHRPAAGSLCLAIPALLTGPPHHPFLYHIVSDASTWIIYKAPQKPRVLMSPETLSHIAGGTQSFAPLSSSHLTPRRWSTDSTPRAT